MRIAPDIPAKDAIEEDVPDVPLADPEGVQEADLTLTCRKTSQRAFIIEAGSSAHQKTHSPHNPYCSICVESNQIHMRFVNAGDRKDDDLDAVINILKMLSADHLVIRRAKSGSDNPDSDIACLTVRDVFSGIVMTYPGKEKDAKETVIAYNHSVGGKQEEVKPRVVVKSTCMDPGNLTRQSMATQSSTRENAPHS